MTTPFPVTRCWVVSPREGDLYVGYVWERTAGRARALAHRSDPGHQPGFGSFLDWRIRRCPDLDGLQRPGAAWWAPSDVPPHLRPTVPRCLWTDVEQEVTG